MSKFVFKSDFEKIIEYFVLSYLHYRIDPQINVDSLWHWFAKVFSRCWLSKPVKKVRVGSLPRFEKDFAVTCFLLSLRLLNIYGIRPVVDFDEVTLSSRRRYETGSKD